jgi:hypothetical protein
VAVAATFTPKKEDEDDGYTVEEAITDSQALLVRFLDGFICISK